MIGGTSIGAFMGAVYATYGDYVHMNRCANKFGKASVVLSYGSVYNQMSDLTLPLLSFLTGARFNSILYSIFNDINIEDLLLPFFCTSTDISSHQLKIHTSGPVWRYVRASMTLLNFLPPICDPDNNHLLIDGGYLNVLPADIMLQKGAKHVIAINVSRNSDDCLGDYGDHLSGWTVLWNKLNPFSKKISIPSLSEIQERLCYINCCYHLEKMQKDPNILYVSPPIQQLFLKCELIQIYYSRLSLSPGDFSAKL
ncbi:hypothetical protein MXB_1104 [Myxobolus squamalis]|nr:hypothetical protein MXB_1104 [Myxobolus squamalis]